MKLYGFGPTRSLRALCGLEELDADFDLSRSICRQPSISALTSSASLRPAGTPYWSTATSSFRNRLRSWCTSPRNIGGDIALRLREQGARTSLDDVRSNRA